MYSYRTREVLSKRIGPIYSFTQMNKYVIVQVINWASTFCMDYNKDLQESNDVFQVCSKDVRW
jgi:hypothetical protein